MSLGKYSENFCLAPQWKINQPRCVDFVYISQLNSLNLVLSPVQTWVVTGALVQGAFYAQVPFNHSYSFYLFLLLSSILGETATVRNSRNGSPKT